MQNLRQHYFFIRNSWFRERRAIWQNAPNEQPPLKDAVNAEVEKLTLEELQGYTGMDLVRKANEIVEQLTQESEHTAREKAKGFTDALKLIAGKVGVTNFTIQFSLESAIDSYHEAVKKSTRLYDERMGDLKRKEYGGEGFLELAEFNFDDDIAAASDGSRTKQAYADLQRARERYGSFEQNTDIRQPGTLELQRKRAALENAIQQDSQEGIVPHKEKVQEYFANVMNVRLEEARFKAAAPQITELLEQYKGRIPTGFHNATAMREYRAALEEIEKRRKNTLEELNPYLKEKNPRRFFPKDDTQYLDKALNAEGKEKFANAYTKRELIKTLNAAILFENVQNFMKELEAIVAPRKGQVVSCPETNQADIAGLEGAEKEKGKIGEAEEEEKKEVSISSLAALQNEYRLLFSPHFDFANLNQIAVVEAALQKLPEGVQEIYEELCAALNNQNKGRQKSFGTFGDVLESLDPGSALYQRLQSVAPGNQEVELRRVNAALYYANLQKYKDELSELEEGAKEGNEESEKQNVEKVASTTPAAEVAAALGEGSEEEEEKKGEKTPEATTETLQNPFAIADPKVSAQNATRERELLDKAFPMEPFKEGEEVSPREGKSPDYVRNLNAFIRELPPESSRYKWQRNPKEMNREGLRLLQLLANHNLLADFGITVALNALSTPGGQEINGRDAGRGLLGIQQLQENALTREHGLNGDVEPDGLAGNNTFAAFYERLRSECASCFSK